MSKASINTWINGCTGRMGETLTRTIADSRSFALVGGTGYGFAGLWQKDQLQEVPESVALEQLPGARLAIDFSTPEGNQNFLGQWRDAGGSLDGKAILIATTGLSADQKKNWQEFSEKNGLRTLIAPNTSLGVLTTAQSCRAIARTLRGKHFDIEIIESHHRHKIDSPGGTAKFLAESIASQEGLRPVYNRSGKREQDEIGVFAMRGGSVFGEHKVRFMGDFEEISVSHTAFSRHLFADGALVLGRWLLKKPAGFYHLLDVDLAEIS